MRLSDLLTSQVVDQRGDHLGHVRDVELLRTGPPIDGFGPTYRVHALVIGKGSLGARLGLDREHVHSPWLLRVVFGRRPPRSIPWSDVVTVEDRRIHVRTTNA